MKKHLPLIFILIIGSILRFYNLMYDYPYFFNPDERNMGSSITRFRLPNKLVDIPICILSELTLFPKPYPLSPNQCNLNPHFFAYGQFPLYLAFASDSVIRAAPAALQGQPLQVFSTDFPSAIYWLRFYSALSSAFTVLLVYLITNVMLNSFQHPFKIPKQVRDDKNTIAYYAALMAAFTPGFIQAAHFGTTESLLTFFFLATMYFSLKLLEDQPGVIKNLSLTKYRTCGILSIIIGLSLGSKLTGIFFFIPPLAALIIRSIKLSSLKNRKAIISGLFENLRTGLLVFIGSIVLFILSSPYNLKEMQNFQSAVFGYETDVATGKYDAFYTRQFVDSIPILFQLDMIFPYTLGLPIFILGSFGFLIAIFTLNKNFKYKILIIAISFLAYLIPNAFLFAKWTRFMTPILPFFTIFAAYFIFSLYNLLSTYVAKAQKSKIKVQNLAKSSKFLTLNLALIFALCALSLLPGIAFISIYTHEDTRVTASKWIYQNIPDKSYILSETANVVDIPLSLPASNQRPMTNDYIVISFDFYHLDENPILFEDLLTHLEKADYILIPSRRIFANYPKLPQKYPLVTKYYQLLFSGNLGFEKVKEIKVLNDEQAEETFTVFDHPVIRIYQKVKPFTKKEYTSLFKA